MSHVSEASPANIPVLAKSHDFAKPNQELFNKIDSRVNEVATQLTKWKTDKENIQKPVVESKRKIEGIQLSLKGLEDEQSVNKRNKIICLVALVALTAVVALAIFGALSVTGVGAVIGIAIAAAFAGGIISLVNREITNTNTFLTSGGKVDEGIIFEVILEGIISLGLVPASLVQIINKSAELERSLKDKNQELKQNQEANQQIKELAQGQLKLKVEKSLEQAKELLKYFNGQDFENDKSTLEKMIKEDLEKKSHLDNQHLTLKERNEQTKVIDNNTTILKSALRRLESAKVDSKTLVDNLYIEQQSLR